MYGTLRRISLLIITICILFCTAACDAAFVEKNNMTETTLPKNQNKDKLNDSSVPETDHEQENLPVECYVNVRDMLEHMSAYINTHGNIAEHDDCKSIRVPVREGEHWFIWYPLTTNKYFNYTAEFLGAVRFEDSENQFVDFLDLSEQPQFHFNPKSNFSGPVVVIPSGVSYMYLNLKMTTLYDFSDSAVITRVSEEFSTTWLSLGDSIAEFNATANRNWLHLAAEELSANYYNVATSGYGYLAKGGYSQLFDKLPDNENIELVTIYGSFNDLCFDYEVGEAEDQYMQGATNSLAACMNNTYDHIRMKYSDAKIVVIAPAPWAAFRPDGTKASDVLAQRYVAVMKEICEKKGIYFLDVFSECSLKPWLEEENQAYYHNADACHPNDEGHKLLSEIITPFLKKVLDEG